MNKDKNPKDIVGSKKAPLSTIPANVLMEVGLAMLEGSLKYGRHNYRATDVRASVYYDACQRHIMDWWEGEDIDKKSQIHHVTKAIAGLIVLRDAIMQDKFIDDRPPVTKDADWLEKLNKKAEEMIERCRAPKSPYIKENEERNS